MVHYQCTGAKKRCLGDQNQPASLCVQCANKMRESGGVCGKSMDTMDGIRNVALATSANMQATPGFTPPSHGTFTKALLSALNQGRAVDSSLLANNDEVFELSSSSMVNKPVPPLSPPSFLLSLSPL